MRFFAGLRALLVNRYFWLGFAALCGIAFVFYILINNVALPAYTRLDASVTVPNVREMPYDDAARVLAQHNLRVEQVTQRFNPTLPRDVVIDQNPAAAATVKPGRRIFLTVNSGTTPTVSIPNVEGLSRREAENQLRSAGLAVGDVLPDSIPHPNQNAITRQRPTPGTVVQEGDAVTLWYSTGLSEQYVTVPDVTNLTVDEAQGALLGSNLRAVVIGGTVEEGEAEGAGQRTVVRQSHEPGTRVRGGFEIRLFVETEEEEEEL